MQIMLRASLQKRVILLVALGTFVVLVVFGISSLMTVNESIRRTLEERLVLARATGDHVDYILRQNLSYLNDMASSRTINLDDGDLGPEKQELHEAYLHTIFSDGVYLIDRSGKLLWIEPYRQSAIDTNLASLPHVKKALETGTPVVSNVFSLEPMKRPVVSIISPIKNRSGEIVGAIGGDIDLINQSLQQIIRPVGLGASGYIQLVDGNGVVLTATRAEDILTTSDHDDRLKSLIADKQTSVSTCHGCHQTTQSPRSEVRETEVMAFAPLTSAPWGVIIRESEREALAPARQLQTRFLVFSLPLFVLSLFFAWATAQSVVKPIGVLTAEAEKISAGNLSDSIPHLGQDEVGKLAQTFDTMRERLKASLESIQEWNRELEGRVQQRTRELQESRDYLQTIVDSISDEMMVIDKSYRISLANTAIIEERGRASAQVIGNTCYAVSHNRSEPCRGPEAECPAAYVWQTGRPMRALHIYENGDNREVFKEVVISPLKDSSGNVIEVVELIRDVTEEKMLEQQVIVHNRELSLLNAVSNVVSVSLNLDTVLHDALDVVLELMAGDIGAIELLDAGTSTLQLAAYQGCSLEFAEGIGRIAREPVKVNATGGSEDLRLENTPLVPFQAGLLVDMLPLRSLIQAPLIFKGVQLGRIWIATSSGHTLTAREEGTLLSIGSQIAVAVENARLYAEIQRKEALRGELLRQVISAQEEERKRIARELHDDTSQALAALVLSLEAASISTSKISEEIAEKFASMKSLATKTLEEVHKLIFDLRPSVLDDLGLLAALNWYAESRLSSLDIKVNIETVGDERRLPPEIETALFRIVQEAVSNIARHAEAENVAITLEFCPDLVVVEVEDDGIGFAVDKVSSSSNQVRGLGILGMSERVMLLDGKLDIRSEEGSGTTVRIVVPLT